MKNLAVILSLLVMVSTLGGCSKGCKSESTTPPTDTAVIDKKDEVVVAPTKEEQPQATEKDALMNELELKTGDKLFAEFDTSFGPIKVELFWEKAPKTVRNFVQLAKGTKEWVDPNSGEKTQRPLYNGTIFHRVIKGFMIQGGDPTGTGRGGPGYKFEDEFHPDLSHNKKGVLSMANAGPNTNGSQFFLMDEPTTHLDRRHSVFGQADDASIQVISKIASTPTDQASNRPLKDVTINKVTITKS